MPESKPNVTEITEAFLTRMVDALASDPSEAGQAALDFVKEKRDVLIGLAAEPFANLLKSIGSGSEAEMMEARRAFVASLPTASLVNDFYEQSVSELESSVEAPLRLGSFLKSLADVGAKVAPRLVGVVASLIGI